MKVDRKKLARLATIGWYSEPDQTPIRGNALDSGDPHVDKAYEDKIIARVRDGDAWAWCVVTCTASYAGFRGIDSLGACTYADEADFQRSDYAGDLRHTAIESLACEIESDARRYLGDRGEPAPASAVGKVAVRGRKRSAK